MQVSDLSVGLIQYFVGTDNLYAVVLGQEGLIERYRLASCAEVLPDVDFLLDVLEQPYAWTSTVRARVVREFSEVWGQHLLPPPEALRPFHIVTIIPHHFLHGVPLHLVRINGHLLATTYGIAYCSSSSLLARCVDRNRARQFDAKCWTFSNGDGCVPPVAPPVKSCLSCAVDILTNKDPAYQELARAFASQFPEQATVASRSEIKNALSLSNRVLTAEQTRVHPDTICLVCHGYCDPVHNNRSGLLLAARRGVTDLRNVRVHGDTMLRIRDHPFAEMPLHFDPVLSQQEIGFFLDPEIMTTSELQVFCEADTQLVALFGCSTGTGAVASNDDYASQAYQWLKCGAASVIANLWEADFAVIADWAPRFAMNWVQRRQPKVVAARDATRALLAERPEFTERPELWGSLAVLGDWL